MPAKRVLVTGGAGFLGSHLCERLLESGNDVVCADNLSTGHLDNISHLIGNPKFQRLDHDIVDPLDIEVDEIYNLACPASPVQYQLDPVKTIRTNVLGAMNVLDLARRCNATVLQASTSEVYGDPLEHPQHETYNGNVDPIGPRSCYDEGKRCAESLFFSYRSQYGVRIKVIRIFNTYGPRMHPNDGRVVSNFIVQALRGEPLTVHGKGQQTRSFCYVDDLIAGMMTVMATEDSFTGPVNVGNPAEVTVRDLAREIIALAGSESTLIESPEAVGDPKRRKPDIGMIERLGWQPRTARDVGLGRTVDYFRTAFAPSEHGKTSH